MKKEKTFTEKFSDRFDLELESAIYSIRNMPPKKEGQTTADYWDKSHECFSRLKYICLDVAKAFEEKE